MNNKNRNNRKQFNGTRKEEKCASTTSNKQVKTQNHENN